MIKRIGKSGAFFKIRIVCIYSGCILIVAVKYSIYNLNNI